MVCGTHRTSQFQVGLLVKWMVKRCSWAADELDWLASQSIICILIVRLAGWLAGRLVCWLVDSLVGWLVAFRAFSDPVLPHSGHLHKSHKYVCVKHLYHSSASLLGLNGSSCNDRSHSADEEADEEGSRGTGRQVPLCFQARVKVVCWRSSRLRTCDALVRRRQDRR